MNLVGTGRASVVEKTRTDLNISPWDLGDMSDVQEYLNSLGIERDNIVYQSMGDNWRVVNARCSAWPERWPGGVHVSKFEVE